MWHEVDYKHKVPSAEGAEQELKWRLTKKVTEFIQYGILFTIHMWEVKDVQVEGRKEPLMKRGCISSSKGPSRLAETLRSGKLPRCSRLLADETTA